MSERRSGSFLAYAVGEIVLAAIGILIALQINNWNEERVEQRQVRAYPLNLAADIQRDLDMILPVDLQIQRLMQQAEWLAARELPLLTDDLGEVRFLVNQMLEVKNNVEARPSLEWPRLAAEFAVS